jgi:alpha-N-arabinofuranosidase
MAAAWAQRFAALGVTPKYWEVGNEIYLSGPAEDGPNGRAIYHAPDQYAHDFPAYRSAIQGILPDAKVGAIGYIDTGAFALAPADNRDWTTKMLVALTTRADFIAVHDGYAPVILDDSVDFSTDAGRRRAYEALYAGALQTRANLDQTDAAIARLSPANKDVPLAVTEFGPFFGVTRDAEMNKAYVDQTRTLAAALYVASVLDTLIGDPRVFMACYTNPIHHWYGSLITDTDAGLVKTPTYYLYQLYRTRFESKLIATDVVVSPSDASSQVGIVKPLASVPELLAKASVSADGKKLTAMLVNRGLDRPLATTIEVKSFAATAADCQVLTAPSPAAINGTAVGNTVVSGGPEIRPLALACKATASGGGTTIELSVPPSAVVSVVASS